MEQELFDLNHPVSSSKATKKMKKRHQLLIQIIYDFTENSTLNGLKYVTGQGVSIMGKFFWISMFILSILLSSWMVHKTYIKWVENSVLITLMEHPVKVNQVPFPAVTICPQARIRQRYYNYTEEYYKYYNLHDKNKTFCDIQFHSTTVLCYEVFHSCVNLQNTNTDINAIFKVSPKVNDVLDYCIWRNKYDCYGAFHPVLTAEGVCFTFNSLAADEIFRKNSVHQQHLYINTSAPQNGWSLYKNYENTRASRDDYPARGRANGAQEDLFIVLKEVTDRDFLCEGHTETGYKVYLNHPAELPQASLHYYAAHPERTTSLALNLNILGTSKELLNYSPKFRQCYFPYERPLQFFKNYTSKNCQLECLTNYTLQECGCVNYHMPRNSSIEICKMNQIVCVLNALDKYAEGLDDNNSNTSQCQCLPSCYDINYGAEAVVTKFDQKELDKKMGDLDCLDNYFNNYFNVANYDANASNETQTGGHEITTELNSLDIKNNINETKTQTSIPKPNCKYIDATQPDYTKITQIRMYYRYPQFVAMQRSEMFGISQFLADCGGTLGFFLGFSFLTLAEIFYFTLKLCCDSREENSEDKKKVNEIV